MRRGCALHRSRCRRSGERQAAAAAVRLRVVSQDPGCRERARQRRATARIDWKPHLPRRHAAEHAAEHGPLDSSPAAGGPADRDARSSSSGAACARHDRIPSHATLILDDARSPLESHSHTRCISGGRYVVGIAVLYTSFYNAARAVLVLFTPGATASVAISTRYDRPASAASRGRAQASSGTGLAAGAHGI